MRRAKSTKKGSLFLKGGVSTVLCIFQILNRKLKSYTCEHLCDRWRIVDEVTEEFNLDARPSSSDAENP